MYFFVSVCLSACQFVCFSCFVAILTRHATYCSNNMIHMHSFKILQLLLFAVAAVCCFCCCHCHCVICCNMTQKSIDGANNIYSFSCCNFSNNSLKYNEAKSIINLVALFLYWILVWFSNCVIILQIIFGFCFKCSWNCRK